MFSLSITTIVDDGNGDVIHKSTHECSTFESASNLALEISGCVKEVLESHITINQ